MAHNKISLYEFSRWTALIEAVDLIAEKCEDRGIDFDGREGLKYIKPLDILDYVDKRADALQTKFKISREIEKNLHSIKCLQISNQLRSLEVVD
jgi:hypothetical protein